MDFMDFINPLKYVTNSTVCEVTDHSSCCSPKWQHREAKLDKMLHVREQLVFLPD
jgi:hypothetical protein